MHQQVQELEMAVLYAYKLGNEAGHEAATMKDQATRFCDSVRQSENGWQLALSLLNESAHAEARFFALTTLQEALGARPGSPARLGEAGRDAARAALGAWLAAGGARLAGEPGYVRTKAAVVLALLAKRDYPGRWPGAFRDLLALARQSAVGAGFYARFLEAVDEDVVAFHVDRSPEEVERNTAVKDHLRATADAQEAVGFLADWAGAWLAAQPGPGGEPVGEGGAAAALGALGRLAGWVPLPLLCDAPDPRAGGRVLPVLFAAAARPDAAQAAEAALGCLAALAARGMPPGEKLRLLRRLGLLSLLGRVPLGDGDVAERVAELVENIGQELLDCWDQLGPHATSNPTDEDQELASHAAAMLQEVFSLFLNCLGHDDVDISSAMLPFAQRFTTTLKNQVVAGHSPPPGGGGGGGGGGAAAAAASFDAAALAPRLYRALADRLPLDPAHRFDPNDEDEGEEEQHRKQLAKAFVNLTRITPELGLRCVVAAAGAALGAPGGPRAAPWPRLEAALRLVYHFSEGCTRQVVKHTNPSAFVEQGEFPALVAAIHSSDIRKHTHPQILLLYYNITIRYSKVVLDTGQHLIPEILETIAGAGQIMATSLEQFLDLGVTLAIPTVFDCWAMFEKWGLGHPTDGNLRARACYLLLRLVKALRDALGPYVGAVAQGVEQLLDSPALQASLGPADLLNLYQALGTLVALPSVQPEDQQRYLEALFAKQVFFVQELLASPFLQGGAGAAPGPLPEETARVGERLAHHVAAAGHLSQGLRRARPQLLPAFAQVLEAASAALAACPGSAALRARACFLLHRLVVCLGAGELVPRLHAPLRLLVDRAGDDDLPQVTSLINDFIINFKKDLFPVIDPLFLPIVEKTFIVLEQQSGGGGGGGAAAAAAANGVAAAAVPTHLPVAREAAARSFLSVVLHLATHGLGLQVLGSPTNAPRLDGLLEAVMQCLGQDFSPTIKKHTISIFGQLLNEINTVGVTSSELCTNLARFICDVVFPKCLKCVIVDIDLEDASSLGVILKLSEFMLILKTTYAENYSAFLIEQLGAATPCPAGPARSFAQAVAAAGHVNAVASAVKDLATFARQ